MREHGAYMREHGRLELVILKQEWKVIVCGAIMQYVHSIMTNLVYYHHRQGERLKDVGFYLFGNVPSSLDWVSEAAFFGLLSSCILYVLLPFFTRKPSFYSASAFSRFLLVAGCGQVLRSISFLSTILPSPAAHCQPGSLEYNPPTDAKDVIFRVDGINGCGDLIFSSHTLLATTLALLIMKYSPHRIVKIIVWIDVAFLGIMVIALKKHYTVDVGTACRFTAWNSLFSYLQVVIAWYTMPMLFYILNQKYPDHVPPELQAHISGAASSNEKEPRENGADVSIRIDIP